MFIYVSLWDFMEDMLVQGRGLPEIKKEIMKQFDVGFREADRLVRTEAAYVLNKASVQRYREAGLKIIQWSTGPEDGKECEICAARSDKVYLIDEAPLIPAHPNCRCVYAGVVELSTEDIAVDGPEAERKIEAMQAAKGIKPLKNTAESGTIKARDEEILKQIRSSETNKNLNVGNQNKHIRSNRQYTSGRSYIIGGLKAARKIIDKYHGTGQPQYSREGDWNGREVVDVDHDFGVYVDLETGEEISTNRGTIHYGKRGTHIVPARKEPKK